MHTLRRESNETQLVHRVEHAGSAGWADGRWQTATPTAAVEEPTVAATEAPAATEAATEEAATEEAATEEATEEAATEGELLWNPQLLQAFSAAIDREELVDRVFEGPQYPGLPACPEGYDMPSPSRSVQVRRA
jgi:hypothetical protein